MQYLKRLGHYSREQLLPGSRLALAFFMALFTSLLLGLYFKVHFPPVLLVPPVLTVFFLLLYYRISDEFKDFETDKKYFPDRPIPSGRVKLSDLRGLLYLLSGLSIAANLISPYAYREFFVAWIFTVLMGKWFYMEKWISSNRLIAFITHAPVGYLLSFYVIRYYLRSEELELGYPAIFGITGFLVLPGLTWEILRKTFLPKDEMEGYQTYSALVGFKTSLVFGLFFVVVTVLSNYLLINQFQLLSPTLLPLNILNALMALTILLQLRKPWTKNLRLTTEVYMGLHLLLPVGFLLWRAYV